jgi:glycosyltransferase involved in cell wall biosynthesis
MYRILYLSPRPSPPSKNSRENMFYHLSRYFGGDLLAPIWWGKNPESIKKLKEVNLGMGNFQYHVTFRSKLPKLLKIFSDISFYLSKGLYLHYFKGKYDAIIAYGPFKTGLAGYLLKKITGAKLIIEVPGNPWKSFSYESGVLDRIDRLKIKIGNLLVRFVINGADHVKLLYPSQLDGYKSPEKNQISVFHNLVPISIFKTTEIYDKYILFLGHPFFLKGVDILIKAFQSICHEFPDYRLKIVGFCPDKKYYEKLADGNHRIELCNPVFYDEAMRLMSKCSLFILPSRTEAMGRVLIEAMAFKKPIIASNVDGIPHYIKNDFNGLLFQVGNVGDLAEKMRYMLYHPEHAATLAKNGHEFVHTHFSEERFVECFKEMVEKVLERSQ